MNQLVIGYWSSYSLLKKKSVKRKTMTLRRAGMRNLKNYLNPPPGVIGSYSEDIPSFPTPDRRNRLIFTGFQHGQREWELSQAPEE